MNASEILATAERNASVRGWALRLLFVVAGLTLFGGAYCAGKRNAAAFDAIAASKQVTAAAEIVRAAAIETVTVAHRVVIHDSTLAVRADSALAVALASSRQRDSLASILSATTVRVHDTVATIPAEVISRLIADSLTILSALSDHARDSTLIGSMRDETVKRDRREAADDSVIASQAHTIDLMGKQHAPRCGFKCGATAGGLSVLAVVAAIAYVIH